MKTGMWQEAEAWAKEKVIPWAKMARKERGEQQWWEVEGEDEVLRVAFTGMQVNTKEEGRHKLEKIGVKASDKAWNSMGLRTRRDKSACIITTVVEVEVRVKRGLKRCLRGEVRVRDNEIGCEVRREEEEEGEWSTLEPGGG